MAATSLRQKLVLFGTGLSLVLLEGGMRLAGQLMLSRGPSRAYSGRDNSGPNTCRILCLGESTTFGPGKDSYPEQLEKILNAKNTGARFSVINKGVPGTDTSQILRSLPADLDRYRPDMVVTMMGVNDIWHLPPELRKPRRCMVFLDSLKTVKLFRTMAASLAVRFATINLSGRKADRTATDVAGDAGALLASANRSLLEGDIAGTENFCREILKADPGNAAAYGLLGAVYRERGRFDEAEEMFRKSVEKAPRALTGYDALTQFYVRRDSLDAAERTVRSAMKAMPRLGVRSDGVHPLAQERFPHRRAGAKGPAASGPRLRDRLRAVVPPVPGSRHEPPCRALRPARAGTARRRVGAHPA